jgi:hypothetical protein
VPRDFSTKHIAIMKPFQYIAQPVTAAVAVAAAAAAAAAAAVVLCLTRTNAKAQRKKLKGLYS